MSSNHNDSGITILSMIEIYKKLIDYGISLENLISLYEWMVKCGTLKEGSAGHQRLNQLKLRYKKGERYVKTDK